jgi:hypothetical protein
MKMAKTKKVVEPTKTTKTMKTAKGEPIKEGMTVEDLFLGEAGEEPTKSTRKAPLTFTEAMGKMLDDLMEKEKNPIGVVRMVVYNDIVDEVCALESMRRQSIEKLIRVDDFSEDDATKIVDEVIEICRTNIKNLYEL